MEALRDHRVRLAEDRLAAGPLWKDHGLVFASTVGTPQDDHNVRRQFRVITEAAGLGNTWVHPSKRGLVTVSGKPSDDLHPKTRDSILRQAGLNEDGSQAEQAGKG